MRMVGGALAAMPICYPRCRQFERIAQACIERIEVDVPYKVPPVQFGFAEEKVDPIFFDDLNALCESERARLGYCDG